MWKSMDKHVSDRKSTVRLPDLRQYMQGRIIPRANMMNISDPGEEPTIVLMSTPKRRNAVSMDAKALVDAADIIMPSSTPGLGASGRSEQQSSGQKGSQRRMTLIELQGKISVASKTQSVAEEERVGKTAPVPTFPCSTILVRQFTHCHHIAFARLFYQHYTAALSDGKSGKCHRCDILPGSASTCT
jgi:hypothetical protein